MLHDLGAWGALLYVIIAVLIGITIISIFAISSRAMKLFIFGLLSSGAMGIILARVDLRSKPSPLVRGKCYIHRNDESFGPRYSYVQKIHKVGKNDTYLAEQWDYYKGWYGIYSIRRFIRKDYMEIQCPLDQKYIGGVNE